MAKKRASSKPGPRKRAAKREEAPLVSPGGVIDGLEPPNQLIPPAPESRNAFPLLALKLPPKAGARSERVFVHPRYGNYHWQFWDNTPPTWMDPHLLVTMCKHDAKVRLLLQKAVDKNAKKTVTSELASEVLRVFAERYEPWVRAQFERVCPLLAEWLIMNAAAMRQSKKHEKEEESGEAQSA